MASQARNAFNVVFYAEGAPTPLNPGGLPASLAASTVYYAVISGSSAFRTGSIQWTWDAAIVATITYESTNKSELAVSSATGWALETAMPPTAIPGGSASTNITHAGDYGGLELRARIAVGATGGALEGRAHWKD